MQFHMSADEGQQVRVIVTRKAGSQFYAGPTDESPRAREASNSLGTPIKGRDEAYPLLVNFPDEKQQLSFVDGSGKPVTLDVAGATATLVVSETDLEALNGQSGNAWIISARVAPSAPNTQDPQSLLFGSLWLEPVGELSAVRAPGLVSDADLAAAAIRANAARAAEGRQQRRLASDAARGAQVKA